MALVTKVMVVTKVMEGLRGDAFLMAKDLGLKALMDVGPPTGLELLVERIKEHVFPLRSHEARELVPSSDNMPTGPLSVASPLRQSCPSLEEGRRWWIQLEGTGYQKWPFQVRSEPSSS